MFFHRTKYNCWLGKWKLRNWSLSWRNAEIMTIFETHIHRLLLPMRTTSSSWSNGRTRSASWLSEE